jgi:hypothetical protein
VCLPTSWGHHVLALRRRHPHTLPTTGSPWRSAFICSEFPQLPSLQLWIHVVLVSWAYLPRDFSGRQVGLFCCGRSSKRTFSSTRVYSEGPRARSQSKILVEIWKTDLHIRTCWRPNPTVFLDCYYVLFYSVIVIVLFVVCSNVSVVHYPLRLNMTWLKYVSWQLFPFWGVAVVILFRVMQQLFFRFMCYWLFVSVCILCYYIYGYMWFYVLYLTFVRCSTYVPIYTYILRREEYIDAYKDRREKKPSPYIFELHFS